MPLSCVGDCPQEKARTLYTQLTMLAAQADSERPELLKAKALLGRC